MTQIDTALVKQTLAHLSEATNEASEAPTARRHQTKFRKELLAQDDAILARLIENLTDGECHQLVSLLGKDFRAEILPSLSEEKVGLISPLIGQNRTLEALEELPSDDAVAVVEKLQQEERQEILERLPVYTRHHIESSLAYPAESVARLMQREVVAVPQTWNVGQVIDYLREQQDLPNKFYDLQVINPKGSPVGALALDTLLRTPRHTQIAKIVDTSFATIKADADQEEAAFLFRDKDLTSLAVVDESDRLIGVITVDDIVDVIDEEAGEDLMKLSGVSGGEKFYGRTLATIRHRFGWLLLNLFITFLAAMVIGVFTDSIQQMVTLAMFMPIAASMGGVAAVQTLAITVRALAMKTLISNKQLWAIGREIAVNTSVGLLLGGFAALATRLIVGDGILAMVVGGAVLANVVFGGFLGVAIPIALKRAKLDPAVAGGPCATMGTDLFGLFTFLGLATLYAL